MVGASSAVSETPAPASQPVAWSRRSGVPDVAGAAIALPSVQAQPRPIDAPGSGCPADAVATASARAVNVARLATWRMPDTSKVDQSWWIFVILLLAVAVLWSVLVAGRAAFSHARSGEHQLRLMRTRIGGWPHQSGRPPGRGSGAAGHGRAADGVFTVKVSREDQWW